MCYLCTRACQIVHEPVGLVAIYPRWILFIVSSGQRKRKSQNWKKSSHFGKKTPSDSQKYGHTGREWVHILTRSTDTWYYNLYDGEYRSLTGMTRSFAANTTAHFRYNIGDFRDIPALPANYTPIFRNKMLITILWYLLDLCMHNISMSMSVICVCVCVVFVCARGRARMY
jgi:hypothetical protein